MTKPSERAALRRKKATGVTATTPARQDQPMPPSRSVGPLAAALPTTKRYPHRISLDISDVAYERLRRLNYELDQPKGAILRKLFDALTDEEIAGYATT